MNPNERVVAVTGARSFLGSEIIRRLEEDRRFAKILALDVRQPDLPVDKTQFHRLDLTYPAIDGELASILADEGVDTVIHCAFLTYPTHATSWAHELEDVGTMHVVNACTRALPAKLVMCSTTMVYGARPENPNFLREDHEPRGHQSSRFITDKLRAERQILRFAKDHPDIVTTVLRFAPIIGPTATSVWTRFFSRPVAPVLMGYDPLMQLVHERDAVDALKLAIDRNAAGPFNIVSNGVLPYTTILALMGKVAVPCPRFLAVSLSKVLWATQVSDSPPQLLDYLRYLCVADGLRAKEILGFEPAFDIKRTVSDFLGVAQAEDGAPDVARAQG